MTRKQAVHLDVSDEEITLWDSASTGQIIAVAKYAQPISGAADVLQDCDFTDLDEDGNFTLYGTKNTDAKIGRARRRIGAVVETPSIYMDMTAEENIRQQYLVMGTLSEDGIMELLNKINNVIE